MYVYILKLYSQQHIFPAGNSSYANKGVAKSSHTNFLKYNKNKYSVQLFWESWQHDHHCQEKYIISGSFNRKECYPPECRGGPGGGINPFQFYGSKISRTANFSPPTVFPTVYSSLSFKIFLNFNFLAICDFDSNIFWTPLWPCGGGSWDYCCCC